MPIFRFKSVKIYTGQKNLHGYIRGIRDKYEVWLPPISCLFSSSRSSVWVKMIGGTMQKVRWVVCRTFTAPHHCLRTNCCAKLDPLLKSSNGNVLCVWPNSDQCWKQITVLWCTEWFQGKMRPLFELNAIRLKCSILYKESLWKFCV